MSPRGRLFLCAGILVGAFLIFFGRSHLANGLVTLGDLHFGGGGTYDLSRADLYYRTALILAQETLHAHHQRARIAFLRGDFDEALGLIEQQVGSHGTAFMPSYYIRGLIHGYRKEFAEAERDFKTFLLWDRENWAALNDLAWVYFAQGKFAEAVETSAAGLRIAPENPWLHIMFAMSRFNQGNAVEALEHLRRAEEGASRLTTEDWIVAYPGNNPRLGPQGLLSLRNAIKANIKLIQGVN